jgi:cysteine desulfurase
MKKIYADCAATTKISDKAKEAMLSAFEIYGNPSSLHTFGVEAARLLTASREKIAELIGADPGEIYFTSGGSESDNQALFTIGAEGKKKSKNRVISTTVEHHAILHTMDRLKRGGFDTVLCETDRSGSVEPKDIEALINDDCAGISVMYANNEIGTIEPIQEIAGIAAEHKVLFHTDAVQAAGQLPINVHRDKIDMLSMSAHKFHGPRGIGVLYVRRGIRPYTLISGGAQEKGRRAGTENLPAIAGMAAALEDAVSGMEERGRTMTALRERLIAGLSKIPYSFLNGEREKRLPGNVSFCFEGIEGESLLLHLDFKGIAASSGSACTSGSLDPSHVLLACGLPHEIAHGSLRLTISADNTAEEMDYISAVTAETVSLLRSMSPVWDKLERGELAHFER